MKEKSNNILKILSVIGLILLITVFVILAKTPPATGYEISIYEAYSPLVWMLLIGNVTVGVLIIVYQAFSKDLKNNWWIIGFFMLMINNFTILSLHALRGYFHYGSHDSMTHYRWIKKLMENNHIGSENFYPIIHILSAQIAEICNISPEIVVKYLPSFLSVLFLMFFMWLLAKSALLKKGQVLIVAAASYILSFNSLHVQIYPHVFSLFLYPFIIYLYFRMLEKNSWQFKLLFITLLILLVYTHPSGLAAFIFLLVAMELAKVVHGKRYALKDPSSKIAVNTILVLLITFFMWISSFWFFGAKISHLYSAIFEPHRNPHFLIIEETTMRLEWIEVVEYGLKMYGDNLIYITLALIAGVIIVKKVLNKEKDTKYLFLLFIFVLASVPLEYVLFFGIGSKTFGRMLNLLHMMTVSPVLVGFVLYELFKNKNKVLGVISASSILVLTFSISVLSVYHSPWTFSPSWHITSMDVKGSEWYFAHADLSLDVDPMGVDPSLIKGRPGLIPEHFNYTHHNTLGESLARDSYVVINKRCKLANEYPKVAKARINMRSGWGFDKEDFKKVEIDPSVTKLYTNGEFAIFYIHVMQN